uniref:Uncharacterized protein n=1 Tax=Oryza punctata TaxID=4537 RepID=A0A0E0LZN7_ORYPU
MEHEAQPHLSLLVMIIVLLLPEEGLYEQLLRVEQRLGALHLRDRRSDSTTFTALAPPSPGPVGYAPAGVRSQGR